MLGTTIVAPRAGDMIGEIALAMRTGMFTGRLAQTTHAYPTWSLAIQQAAAQFFDGYGDRGVRPARVGDRRHRWPHLRTHGGVRRYRAVTGYRSLSERRHYCA